MGSSQVILTDRLDDESRLKKLTRCGSKTKVLLRPVRASLIMSSCRPAPQSSKSFKKIAESVRCNTPELRHLPALTTQHFTQKKTQGMYVDATLS